MATKPIETLSSADQATARTGLGLGTAATQAATAFATAAQGAKADSALQDVAGMTTAFNAGTSTQKTAFRSAVAGDGISCLIATIGDSRNFNEFWTDATFRYQPAQGIGNWANALSGQKMKYVAYRGVGGNTTRDILARIDADLGSFNFGRLQFQCDINDVMSSAGIPTDETIANYITIYNWARARGVEVDHIGPYPPQTAITATQIQALLRLRQWILNAPLLYPWVHPVDAWAVLADAASNPPVTPSAYIVDPGVDYGKHLNGAGALRVAPLLAANWAAIPRAATLICTAYDSYGVDATRPDVNLMDNPLMTGSGGQKWSGVTNAPAWVTGTTYVAGHLVISGGRAYLTRLGGTSGGTAPAHTSGAVSDGGVVWEWVGNTAVAGVASGYTAQRVTGSGAVYCCTVARQDGVGFDQLLALAGGAAGTVVAIWPTDVYARAANGGMYAVGAEVGVMASAGLSAPALELATTVGGTSVAHRTLSHPAGYQDSLIGDVTLTLRTPTASIPASGSITKMLPQMQAAWGSASSQGLVRIGRWSCRRIPA